MGTLGKLAEVLQQLPPGGGAGLQERLKEGEVQEGLRQLEAVLRLGLDGDGGGVWQWSKQQVEFGLAIVEAVLSASCDLIAGARALSVCLTDCPIVVCVRARWW